MAKIRLEHVFYHYENQQAEAALQDISLEIAEGEFLCIIGKSGCGKSTVLRLLAGLELPDQGNIFIDGEPVTGPNRQCAVVFQNYTLFPWMTARRNVEFGIRQARKDLSRRDVRDLANGYLEKVAMKEDAEKYPCQLSGGMRQRIAIARSLALDTDILLLDEPFGALDSRIRRELQTLLEQLSAGSGEKNKTIVFVTHDIQEAVFLADRLLYMEPGKLAGELCVPLTRPRNLQDEETRKHIQKVQKQLLGLLEKTYQRKL